MVCIFFDLLKLPELPRWIILKNIKIRRVLKGCRLDSLEIVDNLVGFKNFYCVIHKSVTFFLQTLLTILIEKNLKRGSY